MAEDVGGLIGVCVGICLFIGVILFGCAWATLEPREIALVYDNVQKCIDTDVSHWTSGRRFIGIEKSYLKFPRGLVGYFFNDVGRDVAVMWADWMDGSSLNVWSKQGQTVLIGISMQIQHNPERLRELYLAYGSDPYSALRIKLMQSMKDSSTMFDTLEFFLNRQEVKFAFERDIRAMLQVEDFYKLEMIQLRSIELPGKFEQKVLTKLLAYQYYNAARNQQDVDIGTAKIEEVRQGGEANAMITLIRAQAEGTKMVNVYNAYAQRLTYAARANEYGNLMQALGWSMDREDATQVNDGSFDWRQVTSDFPARQALHFYAWSMVQANANSSEILAKFGVENAMLIAGH